MKNLFNIEQEPEQAHKIAEILRNTTKDDWIQYSKALESVLRLHIDGEADRSALVSARLNAAFQKPGAFEIAQLRRMY